MPVIRWTFHDTVTDETYTLAANPKEGGAPSIEKNFQYQPPAAPDGSTLVFEGRDKPQSIEFQGFILKEEHDTAFRTWAKKRNPIEITDDLGRVFTVVIEEYVPTRKHSVSHKWRHDYRIKATLLVPY
jgi:hypothetical protein